MTSPFDPPTKIKFDLDGWKVPSTLLEKVAEADSWEVKAAKGMWFIVWFEPGSDEPQTKALGVAQDDVEPEALRAKLEKEVKVEKRLLEAAESEDPPAGSEASKDAKKKSVTSLAGDAKTILKKTPPKATSVEPADDPTKLPPSPETKLDSPAPHSDPESSESSSEDDGPEPLDFTKVADQLRASGEEATKELCVKKLHEQLGARVVKLGTKPEDGCSLLAGKFLLPDDKLVGLRVVGIGKVDSSGSRGRFAKAERVKPTRVDVDFEDDEGGFCFNKDKAEPVDVSGLSLITGEEVFSKPELNAAATHRQAARSKNKLDQPRAPASPSPGADRRAGNKKRKAVEMEPDVQPLDSESAHATELKRAMEAFADGLGHLTHAGVLSAEAFQAFKYRLDQE